MAEAGSGWYKAIAMLIPRWITFAIAGLVIVFGLYRFYVGAKTDPETLKSRRGLYGLPPRTHYIFGALYLLLGAFLIASAFGYSPFQ